jgi:hypothetical protein
MDEVYRYLAKKRGRAPELLEWLTLNYLGDIPRPLNAEALAEIPKRLRGQIRKLPLEYLPEWMHPGKKLPGWFDDFVNDSDDDENDD